MTQPQLGGTPATAPKSGWQWSELWLKEDWWAIWLGLGIILAALAFFYAGGTLKPLAVTPPRWENFATVTTHLAKTWPMYLLLYAVFCAVFTIAATIMGHKAGEFIPGFTLIYIVSLLILIASSWKYASVYSLEAPLIALILGLIVGNGISLPRWLNTAFRTEFYIKTGIVLLGATLPLTLIIHAGPIAFIQATIVSFTTFITIWLVGVKVFKLDKRFASVLGAAGSVCGVSAAIAVGGAVKADKDHVSIGISIVSLWAIVWIFLLPIICKALGLSAAVSGAWIGTSEFADAAGFAAAAAIGHETAIHTFTLMKVIGRDIWIGLWAFILAFISCCYWDAKDNNRVGDKPSAVEIWLRFPKFVLGFFAAVLLMSFVASGFTQVEFGKLVTPKLIAPIKDLRTWTFVFTFLCIGLTTRFRELAKFGWAPFWAFTAGVAVNVPLGFILSTMVFVKYWSAVN